MSTSNTHTHSHTPLFPAGMVCSSGCVTTIATLRPPLLFHHSLGHPARCQGGISCASPDRPCTHTHTLTHARFAGWRTKPLMLPIEPSDASTVRRLFFFFFVVFCFLLLRRSNVWHGHCRLSLIASSVFLGDEGEKRSGTSAHFGLFSSSWDAGGAQREQQVGIVSSRMLSLFPRRPTVCLLLLVTLTLEDVVKHIQC